MIDQRYTTTYVNDAKGHPLTITSETDEGADGSVDIRSSVTTTYDKKGRELVVSGEQDFDADGVPESRSTGRRSTTPTATSSTSLRSSTTERMAPSMAPATIP